MFTICCTNNEVNNLEQLSNISQLRNLWLRSPEERLACWREFRLELQAEYSVCDNDMLSSLNAISTWWAYAPIVNVAMDPFNLKTWPNIWELIHQGECCKYSRGVAMAYNTHYIDQDAHVTVSHALDTSHNDEYFITVINERYILNSLHKPVIDLQSNHVDFVIKESWSIQDIIDAKQD